MSRFNGAGPRVSVDIPCLACKSKAAVLDRAAELNVLWTRLLKVLVVDAGGQVAISESRSIDVDDGYHFETAPHPDGAGLILRVSERVSEGDADGD